MIRNRSNKQLSDIFENHRTMTENKSCTSSRLTLYNYIFASIMGLALIIMTIILSIVLTRKNTNLNKILQIDGSNNNPYRLFGTKTIYKDANKTIRGQENLIELCKPTFFYYYGRHAIRYPDEDKIIEMKPNLIDLRDKIVEAFENNKSKVASNVIKEFRYWNFNMVPENDNRITESGKKEAFNLGESFKSKFPKVFGKNYPNDGSFLFGYTSQIRTYTTLRYFLEGIYGKEEASKIDLENLANDDLIRFHKLCIKIRGSKPISKQAELFKNGTEMNIMMKNVSLRIGFEVEYDKVTYMYDACKFGYAIDGGSPWCDIFTKSDLQVLEYHKDVDDYDKDGYGHAQNYEQACPIVKDLIEKLEEHGVKGKPARVIYMSHAGGLKKVISRLGLFKDEKPLLASNFNAQEDRKWRSSFLCPFSSSIAFVVQQCQGGKQMISTFVQERPVIVDGCASYQCPLADFLSHYKPMADHCNLTEICQLPTL